jgi:hypothetical protein
MMKKYESGESFALAPKFTSPGSLLGKASFYFLIYNRINFENEYNHKILPKPQNPGTF